jgi:uncharacterized protein YyaL (SSP411 family)
VVFEEPAWLDRAIEAYDFIRRTMLGADGRIAHALRLGRVSAVGLLDDQAAMARAALALHEATGRDAYRAHAIALADVAELVFADGQGGFYTTASDADDVPLTRPRNAADNATPAANGVMAEVLARLYHLTGDAVWRLRCEALLRAFGGDARALSSMPGLLTAADLLEEAACVVIAGDPADPRACALRQAALGAPDLAVVVLGVAPDQALPRDHPAHGKGVGADGPVAYLCRRSVCGLPIAEPAALASALRRRGLD